MDEFYRQRHDEGERGQSGRQRWNHQTMGSNHTRTSQFCRYAIPMPIANVLHVLRNSTNTMDRAQICQMECIVVRGTMPYSNLPGWQRGVHPLFQFQTATLNLHVQRRLVSDVRMQMVLRPRLRWSQLRSGNRYRYIRKWGSVPCAVHCWRGVRRYQQTQLYFAQKQQSSSHKSDTGRYTYA